MFFDSIHIDARAERSEQYFRKLARFILEHDGMDCTINRDSVTVHIPCSWADTPGTVYISEIARTKIEVMAILGY